MPGTSSTMGIGGGIFVFALGAILAFAVRSSPKSFNVPTVGVVLMIVGAVAFVTSLYIERNRRHLIEESIEHDGAQTPPLEYDDQVFIEPDEAPGFPVTTNEHPRSRQPRYVEREVVEPRVVEREAPPRVVEREAPRVVERDVEPPAAESGSRDA